MKGELSAAEKKQQVFVSAKQLFYDPSRKSAPSVREIAKIVPFNAKGEDHPAAVSRYFHYAALVSALNKDLNQDAAKVLRGAAAGETALEAATNFFRALALFDLAPERRLLRRTAGKQSWERKHDERTSQSGIKELLATLTAGLSRFNVGTPDRVAQALWELYQEPLRLALIDALLAPSVENSAENAAEEIMNRLKPTFDLILYGSG